MVMKFQTPLDRTFTMFPLFDLTAPLPPLEPFELNHTLDQVERILETYKTEPIDVDQMMFNIDPDPIHPEGRGMQVVDKISFAPTCKDQGESFGELLSPLLQQKKKRSMMDSYEPIAVHSNACAQDQQISKNLKDYGPPTSKKFKSRNEHTRKPSRVKSQKCEDLPELYQDVEETLSGAVPTRT
jgi:hypothetical protein